MQTTMPRPQGLSFVTANPTAAGFTRMDGMLRRERQEEDALRVDAAMRRGAGDLIDGQMLQQAGAEAAQTAPAPAPVIQPGPAPRAGGGAGGGVTIPPEHQAAFDAATAGDRLPGLREVLASYVTRESGWNPQARNPTPGSTATGLGQILASTAARPGFGVQPIPLEARTDPAASLRFMADYMDRRGRAMGLTDLRDPEQMRRLLGGVSDPHAPGHIDRIIQGAGGVVAQAPGAAASAPAGPSMPPRNPLATVVANLARTPGAGQAALQVALQGQRLGMQQQALDGRQRVMEARAAAAGQRGQGGAGAAGAQEQRDRFRAEQLAMTALGRGDAQMANYWAQRAGITIPPDLMENAQGRQRVATGSLLARRFYQDRDQAQAFMRTYTQTGNLEQAFQAAGAPRERAQNFQFRWLQDGEREVLTMLDPRGVQPPRPVQMPGAQPPAAGAAAPPQAGAAAPAQGAPPAATDGQPVTRVPRQGSQARTPAMETRYQMLLRAGMSEREAAAVAAGAAPSANTIANAYSRAVRDATQAAALSSNDPAAREAERDRLVNEAMGVFGPNWRQVVGGPNAPQGGPRTPPPATGQGGAPAAPAAGGGLSNTIARGVWGAIMPGSMPPLGTLQGDGRQPAPAPAAPLRPAPVEGAAPAPAAAPRAGGTPPRPPNVPPGSAYSPSRRMWRSPEGQMFNEDGSSPA